VIVTGPSLAVWPELASSLHAKIVDRADFDPSASPLVVALRPLPSDPAWTALAARVAEGSGLVFVLEHAGEAATSAADVIGILTEAGQRRARMPNTAHALSEAQHPAARFVGRRLQPASS
jgi:hypothetical protein